MGVTVGNFEATFGPLRFFLPILVGGGGSHFGFCFCILESCELGGEEVRLCPGPFDLCCHLEDHPCREVILTVYFPIAISVLSNNKKNTIVG